MNEIGLKGEIFRIEKCIHFMYFNLNINYEIIPTKVHILWIYLYKKKHYIFYLYFYTEK